MRETKYKEVSIPFIIELARIEEDLMIGTLTPQEIQRALYSAYLVGRDLGWCIEQDNAIEEYYNDTHIQAVS